MENSKKSPMTSKEQLGLLFSLKNLAKTAASLIPGAAPIVEIQNQIEGEKVQRSIQALEITDKEHADRLKVIEAGNPATTPLDDWSVPVSEYRQRLVGIGIVYDGSHDSLDLRGEELVQTVAHGCFVDADQVLTTTEALELAQTLAKGKKGKAVVFYDMGWFDFIPEVSDNASGLVMLKVTERYLERWKKAVEEEGLEISVPIESKVRATVRPWIGQEIGFIHEGEAKNVMGYPKTQFDCSTISHFRLPSKYALKVFVSGVLSGRLLRAGSPVFTRQGVLVGVIADTENYESDAGRRAAVKSLLGHSKFTTFTKPQA